MDQTRRKQDLPEVGSRHEIDGRGLLKLIQEPDLQRSDLLPVFLDQRGARRLYDAAGSDALKSWQRVLSTLVYILGFGLVALVLHEFFHFAALRALGGEGYITFGWGWGSRTSRNCPVTSGSLISAGGCYRGVPAGGLLERGLV